MRPRARVPGRDLPVIAIVVAAGGLAAYYALKSSQWAVMTDELQTSKLATSIAQTLSPAPRIHGEHYGAPNQLYPLLISPLYRLLPVPAAFRAAHGLNAVLLASSAWPAYLLARAATGSRAGGYFAASLTVFVPWLALSSTLLTENAAYPAFVWGLFLSYRALVEPSVRRDAAALAGLAVVFLARTQLLVLALAFPVALLAHELGFAAATAEGGGKRTAAREAARRTLAQHPLLAAAYAAGAAGAGTLAAAGSLGSLFGNYAGVLRGDLLPPGIWRAAAVHFDDAVVGAGIAPFLLAAAWSLATVLRPWRREAHAFAALLLAVVPLLTFEAASFDLRFTPGGFVQDRYVLYVVPLLAVGAAAALLEQRERRLCAGLVLAVGIAFPWLAGVASYGTGTVLYWASPAGAFHGALASAGSTIGLSAGALVRWGGLVLALVLAAALWRARGRIALAVVGAAVTAVGAFQAAYVFDRFAVPVTTRPQTIVGLRRDWIDRLVGGGRSVALVPNSELSPEYWWDAEFWNKTVDTVLRVGGGLTFTPFPTRTLSFEPRTGRARGDEATRLLVLDGGELRFHLVGTVPLFRARPFTLVRVALPYRALWVTRGAELDGWTLPGRPVRIRLFAAGRPGRREVVTTLSAYPQATGPQRFTIRSGGLVHSGRLAPGETRRIRFTVCAPPNTFGSASLVARGAVRLPDGRVASLHIEKIETRWLQRACRRRPSQRSE